MVQRASSASEPRSLDEAERLGRTVDIEVLRLGRLRPCAPAAELRGLERLPPAYPEHPAGESPEPPPAYPGPPPAGHALLTRRDDDTPPDEGANRPLTFIMANNPARAGGIAASLVELGPDIDDAINQPIALEAMVQCMDQVRMSNATIRLSIRQQHSFTLSPHIWRSSYDIISAAGAPRCLLYVAVAELKES